MLAGGGRFAAACASAILLEGSLKYSASGGRSAIALCAPTETTAAPPPEAAEPEATDASDGPDRYLAYAAALARLKIVLLKAKGALGAAAKAAAAKGALAAKAAAAKGVAAKTVAAESARYVASRPERSRPVCRPCLSFARTTPACQCY